MAVSAAEFYNLYYGEGVEDTGGISACGGPLVHHIRAAAEHPNHRPARRPRRHQGRRCHPTSEFCWRQAAPRPHRAPPERRSTLPDRRTRRRSRRLRHLHLSPSPARPRRCRTKRCGRSWRRVRAVSSACARNAGCSTIPQPIRSPTRSPCWRLSPRLRCEGSSPPGPAPASVCDVPCEIRPSGCVRRPCHGVLAPRARDRGRIVPAKPVEESTAADRASSAPPCAHRLRWATLLARVFSSDLSACATCGGRLRIIAALTDPASIRTYPEGVGLPAVPPPRAPPPPQFEFVA